MSGDPPGPIPPEELERLLSKRLHEEAPTALSLPGLDVAIADAALGGLFEGDPA